MASKPILMRHELLRALKHTRPLYWTGATTPAEKAHNDRWAAVVSAIATELYPFKAQPGNVEEQRRFVMDAQE